VPGIGAGEWQVRLISIEKIRKQEQKNCQGVNEYGILERGIKEE